MLKLSPRMQLTIIATVLAIVLIFFVGVYPLSYPWRRGLAITVVLIAVALFVLLRTVGDRLKRRKFAETRLVKHQLYFPTTHTKH